MIKLIFNYVPKVNKMKLFKLADGSFAPHPDNRVDAVRLRRRLYTTKNKCEICNSSRLRFTTTNNCMMCQRYKMELVRHFKHYKEGGSITYWPDHVPEINDEKFISDVKNAILTLQENDLTVMQNPCSKHGHIALTFNGGCHYCKTCETPHKTAVNDSNETYVSTVACKGCNKLTLRKTSDKSCLSCGYTHNKHVETTPEQQMMLDNPDMVLSKSDAKLCGLKVYRSGNECKNGHKAWRYVTTSNCIECIKSNT